MGVMDSTHRITYTRDNGNIPLIPCVSFIFYTGVIEQYKINKYSNFIYITITQALIQNIHMCIIINLNSTQNVSVALTHEMSQ